MKQEDEPHAIAYKFSCDVISATIQHKAVFLFPIFITDRLYIAPVLNVQTFWTSLPDVKLLMLTRKSEPISKARLLILSERNPSL